MTLGSPSPPSQTHFVSLLPTQCCSKLCTIVCLGRLLQGGAPLLVFVQPVRELLGPSDLFLSLSLSVEILSPFTQAITLMGSVHTVRYILGEWFCSLFVENNRISERFAIYYYNLYYKICMKFNAHKWLFNIIFSTIFSTTSGCYCNRLSLLLLFSLIVLYIGSVGLYSIPPPSL